MQGLQGHDRSTPGTHLATRKRCNSHRLLDKESAIGRLLKKCRNESDCGYVTFCQGSSPSGRSVPWPSVHGNDSGPSMFP